MSHNFKVGETVVPIKTFDYVVIRRDGMFPTYEPVAGYMWDQFIVMKADNDTLLLKESGGGGRLLYGWFSTSRFKHNENIKEATTVYEPKEATMEQPIITTKSDIAALESHLTQDAPASIRDIIDRLMGRPKVTFNDIPSRRYFTAHDKNGCFYKTDNDYAIHFYSAEFVAYMTVVTPGAFANSRLEIVPENHEEIEVDMPYSDDDYTHFNFGK